MSIYLGGSYGRPPSTARALRALRRIHLSIVSSVLPQGPDDVGSGRRTPGPTSSAEPTARVRDGGLGDLGRHPSPESFSLRSAGGAVAPHEALPVPAGRGDHT